MAEAFAITREDARILEEYVEEFQEGDADLRSRIIANVMAELCGLRSDTVPFDKVEASKVPFLVLKMENMELILHTEDQEVVL